MQGKSTIKGAIKMTERFTFTCEKIGKYWGMGIVDHQTKEPFDEAIYEVNPTSFQDSKDEMEDLCQLMNEMAKENEKLLSERNYFERKKTEYLVALNSCRLMNTQLKSEIKDLNDVLARYEEKHGDDGI